MNRMQPYLARLDKLQRESKGDSILIGEEIRRIKQIAESFPVRMENGMPMSTDLESGLKTGKTIILMRLSDLETELGSEESYTSHLTGQLQVIRVSGYEKFQERFARTRKFLSAYLKRI